MLLLSSTPRRRVSEPSHRHAAHALLVLSLTFAVTACGAGDLFAPRAATSAAKVAQATVVVTPSYSAFNTRSDFDGAGIVDHLNRFDEFSGDLVYPQTSPWTTNAVTYTSVLNIVLGPGVGLGVSSNSVSTEFGAPLSGTFDAADAVTLFGADLTLIGSKVPIGLVLITNVGSYTFNIDVPLADIGQRFFGIALSKSGEYLTGFRFSVGGSGSALLLDNVGVGHVGIPNADPVASVGGPYVGAEGSAVSLSLSASDADADAVTFSWDLGDGTKGSGTAPPASHVYADDGSYDIVLAVADGRGGVDTARTRAVISNVAPSLAAFSVATTPLALSGGSATLPVSATFSDPGTLDTHTASLDCGTGIAAQADVPNETASGTCSFSSPGVYSIRLTVRDDDGGSDTKVASGQVVIYDATAGWVTGGGWISSPLGASLASPSTTSKLTFGFVARYQPGSTTPSGNAELKVSVGKLDFRSTALDWLVVGDATATLQGRGTLNGAGDFAFAVTAIDAAPTDAVRIRIWDRATGAIVYDNQRGAPLESDEVTPLGGGGIQLHSR